MKFAPSGKVGSTVTPVASVANVPLYPKSHLQVRLGSLWADTQINFTLFGSDCCSASILHIGPETSVVVVVELEVVLVEDEEEDEEEEEDEDEEDVLVVVVVVVVVVV